MIIYLRRTTSIPRSETNMLRKTLQGGEKKASRYDGDRSKGKKVKRQSRERLKSTFLVLAAFALMGAGALYVFKDSTDFDPLGPGYVGRLRSRILKRKPIIQNPSLLPPDSIYHLSVVGREIWTIPVAWLDWTSGRECLESGIVWAH